MPIVGVVIGSRSDETIMQDALDLLAEFGIDAELIVASAHRTPVRLHEYVAQAPSRGVEVFIAAAGGAAALPGAIAALTTLPVIGVPLASSPLHGIDALYSVAQMPTGVPVACVAIGSWGARNSAILAAQILGLKYDRIKLAHESYRIRLGDL